ncbi:MAG: hypothetical protein WAL90_12425 [Desulfobacterales bacterium]
MLIHDDIFAWEGFGGLLRLGSGKCRLRILDLQQAGHKDLAHLRPYIVVASDIPESRMSVRSCVGHIASSVAKAFAISPNRMVFVEYYPQSTYGVSGENLIPEHYDAVEFSWHGEKALHPKWRELPQPLLDIVRQALR